MGAMETPNMTFEILRVFAANAALENLRGARGFWGLVIQERAVIASVPSELSVANVDRLSP